MSDLDQADRDTLQARALPAQAVSSQQLAFLCLQHASVLTTAVPLSWAVGAVEGPPHGESSPVRTDGGLGGR